MATFCAFKVSVFLCINGKLAFWFKDQFCQFGEGEPSSDNESVTCTMIKSRLEPKQLRKRQVLISHQENKCHPTYGLLEAGQWGFLHGAHDLSLLGVTQHYLWDLRTDARVFPQPPKKV